MWIKINVSQTLQDLIMRLHKEFEINLPNYYNKKIENEMGTEWLTNRKKYYL